MYNTIKEIRDSNQFKTDPQTNDILFSDEYMNTVDNILKDQNMASGDKEHLLARLDANGNFIEDHMELNDDSPAIMAVMREYDKQGLNGLAQYDDQFLDILDTTKICAAAYEAGMRSSDFIMYDLNQGSVFPHPQDLVSPATDALHSYFSEEYDDLFHEYLEYTDSMFAEQDYIEAKMDLDRELMSNQESGAFYEICRDKDSNYFDDLKTSRQKFNKLDNWQESQNSGRISTDDIETNDGEDDLAYLT